MSIRVWKTDRTSTGYCPDFENELGMYVLVTLKYKTLKSEQIQEVTSLEKKLGVLLIAYEA